MTQAHIAAFKSKTLALIDTLHLTAPEVIGLGLSLAASYAVTAGISRDATATALTDSFELVDGNLPGIVMIKGDAS